MGSKKKSRFGLTIDHVLIAVKDLKDTFIQVCKSLCNKKKEIESALKDIEPKNES